MTIFSRRRTSKRKLLLLLVSTLISFATVQVQDAKAMNVWGIYKEAQRLESQGNYNEAIGKYKGIAPEFIQLKEYGNAAGMYRRIGDDYAKLKQYDDAVRGWDLEAKYSGLAGQTQISLAAKYRADSLRSKASLFAETTPAEVGNAYTHRAKFEPVNGALLGAYAELDPAVHNPQTGNPFYTEEFPKLVGKQHAAYLLYFTYGQPLSSIGSHLDHARAAGTAIELGVQPLNGLDEVKDDDYLHQLARDIEASGVRVFLRFANEMNGDWVPWHEKDPKKYIEKFRTVAKVFHQEAPNSVAMVWAPDRLPEYNIGSYYPGDDAVDWVGVSLYSIFNPSTDPLAKGRIVPAISTNSTTSTSCTPRASRSSSPREASLIYIRRRRLTRPIGRCTK